MNDVGRFDQVIQNVPLVDIGAAHSFEGLAYKDTRSGDEWGCHAGTRGSQKIVRDAIEVIEVVDGRNCARFLRVPPTLGDLVD